jgi:hypothetical protein
MDFRAFATHEFAALVEKLTDASARQAEAAATQAQSAMLATLDALRADHSSVVIENERLAAENAALGWEKNELAARVAQNPRGALIERLSTSIDLMALGSSVDDVVAAAADAMTAEFQRVATFVIRGERFEVGLHHGFAADTSAFSGPAVHAFLQQAIQVDGVRLSRSNGGTNASAFGGAPEAMLTASITVRGEALAVIYADAGDLTADHLDEAVKLTEILRRHATLALERLTLELKTIAELRAYAKMLIDEVEYAYDADTTARMTAADRHGRMKENLRCARQIFQQRVTLEGPAAAAVLDAVIADIVKARADAAFARDLDATARALVAA